MAIMDDRPPADPNKRREWDEAQEKLARTRADQQQAQARTAEETKRKADIAQRDARQIAAKHKARDREEQRTLTERERRRQEYLNTPLTPEEQAKLERMEVAANQAGNPDPDMMRDLSDYRIRAKVSEKKDEIFPAGG